MKTYTKADINKAVKAERKRCTEIVNAVIAATEEAWEEEAQELGYGDKETHEGLECSCDYYAGIINISNVVLSAIKEDKMAVKEWFASVLGTDGV